MALKHQKTNTITDWTQAQLDTQIALGNFPPGTLLADIVLPSDWDSAHVIDAGGLTFNDGSVQTTAAGSALTKTITQTAHGWSVKQWLYYTGTQWDLAIGQSTGATDNRADTLGMVIQVIDANTAVICTSGEVTTTGLTVGQYFLSIATAGAMSQTPPAMPTDEGKIFKPIFVAISTTKGIVQIAPGYILTAVPAIDFATILGGTNSSGAAMLVGNSSSLVPTGTGIITPSNITGLITVDGTDLATSGSGTVSSPYIHGPTTALKAGAASLVNRLFCLANALSSNGVTYTSGEYYTQIRTPFATTTCSGATNSFYLVEFLPAQTVTTANIGVYVTTGQTSAKAKLAFYNADQTTGLPTTLIYESGDLDVSTTNSYASEAHALTFQAGVKYWIGLRNGTNGVVYRGANTTAQRIMGLTSNVASAFYTMLVRTLTYATGATNPWAYLSSDRHNAINDFLFVFSAA